MPTRTLCGAPLPGRGICRKTKGTCPDHQAPAGRPSLELVRPDAPAEPGVADSPAAARDLHASGWWVLERLLARDLEPSRASAAATVLRVLAALPPDPVSRDEALRETELRGWLMHGAPPRNAEEWALAEKLFTPEAVAMFHTWERPRPQR